MRLPFAFIKRDFLIATSYKTAFGGQMLGILASVPMYYFMGELFKGTGSGLLGEYDGDYFAFLLIGMAFLDYHAVSLHTFNQSLRESMLMGTLETVLLSPTTLARLLFYSSLWVYLFTTFRFCIYMLTGLVFGLDLGDANLLGGMAVLLLGIVCFASFGIMSASAIMVIKQGDVFNVLVSTASLFLGGVIYPISLLPDWLQFLSQWIPITHALEGMRLALMKGYSLGDLAPQLLILCAFAVVLLPISLIMFSLSVRWTKVAGTLAQY